MDRLELSVQFTCQDDEQSYLFVFPCEERLQVLGTDVERSRPLRDMLESAAASGETIMFPSGVELSHFHVWAAAVQPDSPVFHTDAESMKRALEVRGWCQSVACSSAESLVRRRAHCFAPPSVAEVLPAPAVSI